MIYKSPTQEGSIMTERKDTCLVDRYGSAQEHIQDELKLLDARLRLALSKFRISYKGGERNSLSGLFVTDEEVDLALREEQDSHDKEVDGLEDFPGAIDNLLDLRDSIDEKRQASNEQGITLPLDRLAKMFSLSRFETDAIIVCLAPEIDSKYEKIYSYLQNDVTKKSPTVSLILELLCTSSQDRMRCRKFFLKSSSLFAFRIIVGFAGSDNDNGSNSNNSNNNNSNSTINNHKISSALKLDDRITSFLLEGDDQIDYKILSFTSLFQPNSDTNPPFEELELYSDLKKKTLEHIRHSNIKLAEDYFILFLRGKPGIGKKTFARSVCSELKIPMLLIDITHLKNSPPSLFADFMDYFFREAIMHQAATYLDNFDALRSEDEKENNLREITIRKSKEYRCLVFIASEGVPDIQLLIDSLIIILDFPEINYSLRKRIWQLQLNRFATDDATIDSLANRFRFTPKQIYNAVIIAENAASMNNGNGHRSGIPKAVDLFNACHIQSVSKISTLAHRVTPVYRWDDIVLPPNKKSQLKEILNHIKHRNTVYLDWGFEQKLSLGKGLNILFAGESGTGKTMAAEIIANELQLDLFKIDLSSIVSKYIGETEKNIDRIFKEAEAGNAVLFFDEADAIFGKRSEIKDSHDRYSNIEVNYLLQKLEDHREIVILASNLVRNIDSAFVRRMQFWIEFPFPEEQNRLNIWKNMFPEKAPRSADIDFEFLARQFNITGGAIKNIVLTGAFLAAEEASPISLRHLIMAIKREYEKMGRPILRSDFGKYYDEPGSSTGSTTAMQKEGM
jgi:AAA+ superfamily predicted ATPase